VLRLYVPFVRRLEFKASFWPSAPVKAGAYISILSDDESHFFWMSYDLHRSVVGWPAWLNIAAGYGVEHLNDVSAPTGWSNGRPRSQLYLGLDINPKGIPIHGEVWSIIAELLSHYKIPLPALQVAPRIKWWWLR